MGTGRSRWNSTNTTSSTALTHGDDMKNQSTTVFWPGHGFYARFGPKLEDWEEVAGPDDPGVDEYEISKIRRRFGR